MEGLFWKQEKKESKNREKRNENLENNKQSSQEKIIMIIKKEEIALAASRFLTYSSSSVSSFTFSFTSSRTC